MFGPIKMRTSQKEKAQFFSERMDERQFRVFRSADSITEASERARIRSLRSARRARNAILFGEQMTLNQ